MKSRIRSCCSSSSGKSMTSSSSSYLKPGALAQLRNSKITAKSKAKESSIQTQIKVLLCQLKSTSEFCLAQPPPPSYYSDMEAFPCFAFSFKNNRRPARCLLRKKLIAVTPVFSGP